MADEFDESGGLDAEKILDDIEEMLGLKRDQVDFHAMSRAERRKLVFRLRTNGHTITQIAETLGMAYTTIQKDSARAVRDIDITRTLEAEVTLDTVRIETLISAYWDRAVRGDLNAARFIDQMLARKHKLLGLEAPKRVDVRMLIERWAQARGLGENVQDVIEAAYEILPDAD